MRLFVDQLTNLDFSYLDAKRGLVGETWLASIELEGELDEQGMICDFGVVKKLIRNWLDDTLDHKLVIPAQSGALIKFDDGPRQHIEWLSAHGTLITEAPANAHAILPIEAIDACSVANWCLAELKPMFPSSVIKLTLRFDIEKIDGPLYHYSHGLQKHLGNCQRIAHGHRSRIDIWRNGEKATDLEQQWANAFTDIYIGTEEHCQEDSIHTANYLFEYQAQQGWFSLSLPKSQCYLMDTETTVELIASHLAKALKKQDSSAQFEVKAYEGLAKGAIVNS